MLIYLSKVVIYVNILVEDITFNLQGIFTICRVPMGIPEKFRFTCAIVQFVELLNFVFSRHLFFFLNNNNCSVVIRLILFLSKLAELKYIEWNEPHRNIEITPETLIISFFDLRLGLAARITYVVRSTKAKINNKIC